jgi:hypothetical protein
VTDGAIDQLAADTDASTAPLAHAFTRRVDEIAHSGFHPAGIYVRADDDVPLDQHGLIHVVRAIIWVVVCLHSAYDSDFVCTKWWPVVTPHDPHVDVSGLWSASAAEKKPKKNLQRPCFHRQYLYRLFFLFSFIFLLGVFFRDQKKQTKKNKRKKNKRKK